MDIIWGPWDIGAMWGSRGEWTEVRNTNSHLRFWNGSVGIVLNSVLIFCVIPLSFRVYISSFHPHVPHLHAALTTSQGPGQSVMALGLSSCTNVQVLFQFWQTTKFFYRFFSCCQCLRPGECSLASTTLASLHCMLQCASPDVHAHQPSRSPGPRARPHAHIRQPHAHIHQFHTLHTCQPHTHVCQPHAYIRQLHVYTHQHSTSACPIACTHHHAHHQPTLLPTSIRPTCMSANPTHTSASSMCTLASTV